MNYIAYCRSPVGKLLMASDGVHLTGLWLEGQKHYAAGLSADAIEESLPIFVRTKRWIDDYFAGREPEPQTLPLALRGSEYRRRIWQLLLEILYGKVVTYGQLAKDYEVRFGQRTSARAVGGAVGRNPISILIPCHRVVGADGSLTGYAGGMEAKRFLLRLEQA